MFPEDVNIMLPLTLGWTWCLYHGAKSLAVKEAKLRVAQAHDAIHKIRLALGFKSSLIRTRVRTAKSQKTKKSAWSSVHGVDAGVQEHARVYSLARDMFDVLEDALPSQESLPELTKADMKVQTLVLGSNEQGQRNEQLPWIWTFGIQENNGPHWFAELQRVHWLRAKAQLERWMEEECTIKNEAHW
ncbi:hypothetical protein BC834DRAFT_848761, partial [Gloeopeniophorella convolvens]